MADCAIGPQDVDGLKVSDYLLDAARQHIEGYISINDVQQRIKAYYETKSGHDAEDEEDDIASANIVKIINEPSFAFSLIGLTSIHRRIFDGVFEHAEESAMSNSQKRNGYWVVRLP